MKAIRIHKSVKKDLENLEVNLKTRIAELFDFLANGVSLVMPVSRPMPDVAHGVHELRLKDRAGQYRIFYYTKVKEYILVFHFFRKKTQATPQHEIEVAKQRLRDLL